VRGSPDWCVWLGTGPRGRLSLSFFGMLEAVAVAAAGNLGAWVPFLGVAASSEAGGGESGWGGGGAAGLAFLGVKSGRPRGAGLAVAEGPGRGSATRLPSPELPRKPHCPALLFSSS
jgi:hypothetical protein